MSTSLVRIAGLMPCKTGTRVVLLKKEYPPDNFYGIFKMIQPSETIMLDDLLRITQAENILVNLSFGHQSDVWLDSPWTDIQQLKGLRVNALSLVEQKGVIELKSLEGIESFVELKRLDISRLGRSISFDGVEYCQNLEEVSIRSEHDCNLASLAHLNLRKLKLSGPLTDFSLLSGKHYDFLQLDVGHLDLLTERTLPASVAHLTIRHGVEVSKEEAQNGIYILTPEAIKGDLQTHPVVTALYSMNPNMIFTPLVIRNWEW